MTNGKKNIQKKLDEWDYVLLAFCILFYLLFPILDGPVWCVDSNGYAIMHVSREPLYPTFLALCRVIARLFMTDYLMVAVFLQSILAGFSTWYLGYIVRRIKNQSRILQLSAILFQFAVTLLCRFAAGRGSAYTNSILTEGLGLSLFVLFSVQLFLFVQTEKKRYLLWTLFYSLLLICLRKQMMITLFIMAVVFIRYILIHHRSIRRFLVLLVMLFVVFMTSKVVDRTYQYMVRGVWMEHSGNSMGILCTLLYSSDVERDQALFEDETLKSLYLEIMQKADEQQILYRYAESGWLNVFIHYADSYDAIGYGIINPVLEEYISLNFDYSEMEAAMKYDEICGKMSRTLLLRHPMPIPFLKIYLYNTWTGLVNSIAREKRILSFYAAAAYFTTGMMAWYLMMQKKKLNGMIQQVTLQSGQSECAVDHYRELIGQIDASLIFIFIVMAGIVMNALVVGIIIFAQSRYMIYGMGLFYTAECMMIYDILAVVKGAGKNISQVF